MHSLTTPIAHIASIMWESSIFLSRIMVLMREQIIGQHCGRSARRGCRVERRDQTIANAKTFFVAAENVKETHRLLSIEIRDKESILYDASVMDGNEQGSQC
jgi:hypothetical protein